MMARGGNSLDIRPITDSEGRIIIKGALVGSIIWDADVAVVLLLKLERFEGVMPITCQTPADWDPIMPTDNSRREDAATGLDGGDALAEPHETKPTVHMLQIAVPVQEALKLGWSLTETANQMLRLKPNDGPIS
jgi:hypothetical protein